MTVLKFRSGGAWQTIAITGPPGAGVPAGGALGDILIKQSATDRDTAWGTSVPLLNLTSAVDATLSSTTHALTLGPVSGLNMALSRNIVQGRSNGANSALYLNYLGAQVQIGGSDPAQFPGGLYVADPSHATSRRATIQLGTGWQMMQDINANGTKDFTLYNMPNNRIGMSVNNIGSGFCFGAAGVQADLVLASGIQATTGSGALPRISSDGNWINLHAKTDAYIDGNQINFRNAGYGMLMHHDGGNFVVDAGSVYTNGQFYVGSGQFFRVRGSGSGIYWEDFGGGWYMIDSLWVRTYNSKGIWSGSGGYGTDAGICAGTGAVFGGKLNTSGDYVKFNWDTPGPGASTWGYVQIRIGNGRGGNDGIAALSMNPANAGIAPIWRCYIGNGESFSARNNPDSAFCPIQASAFNVNSTLREKIDVEPVEDKMILDMAGQVRPIRYLAKVRAQTLRRIREAAEGEADSPSNWQSYDHDCTVDTNCDGTADNPCHMALNDSPSFGFAAEDMHKIIPELVWLDEHRLPAGMDVSQVASVALAGVGALLRRIEQLELQLEGMA